MDLLTSSVIGDDDNNNNNNNNNNNYLGWNNFFDGYLHRFFRDTEMQPEELSCYIKLNYGYVRRWKCRVFAGFCHRSDKKDAFE